MNKSLVALGIALAASVLLAGCGPSSNTVPAEGVLTVDGKPADGVAITVHYGDGNTAVGVTHDQGKFELSYLGAQGAAPGTKLKTSLRKDAGAGVSVKMDTPPTGPPDPFEAAMKNMNAGKEMAEKAKNMKGPAQTNELPPKFASPDTSGITVDIPPGGKKDLKIDITTT